MQYTRTSSTSTFRNVFRRIECKNIGHVVLGYMSKFKFVSKSESLKQKCVAYLNNVFDYNKLFDDDH